MILKYKFEGTDSIAIYHDQNDISEGSLLSYAAVHYRNDKELQKPISYTYILESLLE